jgi:DNA processing protein
VSVSLAWALSCRGRTARAARRLLLEKASPEEVLSLKPSEAAEISGEPLDVVLPLFQHERTPGLEEQKRLMDKHGARLIGLHDQEYPHLLKQISDPPVFLFARGVCLGNQDQVAIVGSRTPTRAGLEAAGRLSRDLAREGVELVSGFARGIDGAAHRAALENGGRTTAVLGSGVDILYPSEHRRLGEDLSRHGTFLSEFPMGTGPKPYHFPIRNRIIAGMVPLVVVVEAAEKSGSLITARHAADFGRDVAAVPGAINGPHAAGSNALLKDGAILIRSVDDILAELPGWGQKSQRGKEEWGQERCTLLPEPGTDAAAVFVALPEDDPRDADTLISLTGLDASRLSTALVLLELDGLVEPLPGAVFVRSRPRG